MLKFLARKALRLLLLLTTVSAVSFALLSSSPVDPVRAYVGADMMRVSPEQRAAIAERWGVNRPPTQRFCRVGRRGWRRATWGRRSSIGDPCSEVIAERFCGVAAPDGGSVGDYRSRRLSAGDRLGHARGLLDRQRDSALRVHAGLDSSVLVGVGASDGLLACGWDGRRSVLRCRRACLRRMSPGSIVCIT